MENKEYTTDPVEVELLADQGHIIEEFDIDRWREISGRRGLRTDRAHRAHLLKKRTTEDADGKTKIFYGDNVIFKQRESRHLSVYSELEFDYEDGVIINVDVEANRYDLLWLRGHSSCHSTVGIEDIVSVFDKSKPHQSPDHLGFSGCMTLLSKPLPPEEVKQKCKKH